MSAKPRTLFAILFGIPILVLAPIWLVASKIPGAGAIEFAVYEKGPHGCRVAGSVPAILVPAAMFLTPDSALDEIRCELPTEFGDAAKIARAALRELARCPDGVLVDVRTDTEVVTIEKRNGSLRVHVDTPDENVHAAVPLSALRSVVAAI